MNIRLPVPVDHSKLLPPASHQRVVSRACLRGFTLLEMVVVMGVIALMAALALPRSGSGTSVTKLRALSVEMVALLRQTRLEALRSGSPSIFKLDTQQRVAISTAASTKILRIPADVTITHEVSTRCVQRGYQIEVIFLADGRSCGSQVTLAIDDIVATIQTNWLVGKSSLRFNRRSSF